jgi:uncharacterized Zn-binding protein involved in type VI secretion
MYQRADRCRRVINVVGSSTLVEWLGQDGSGVLISGLVPGGGGVDLSGAAGGDGEVSAVERRIAEQLAALAVPRRDPRGGAVCPPPYVRRHVAEHAAAGGQLDPRIASEEFLPFVDAGRFRTALTGLRWADHGAAPLLQAWRGAAHAWSWDDPSENASTLTVWQRAALLDTNEAGPCAWGVPWAHWDLGAGDILGRHAAEVTAVAALVLPDGTPVAVTGSRDATVRVWNLDTGQPLGPPLTGHTDQVSAVAALVLPDGTPVAVTGSRDATVRVWNLDTSWPVDPPLAGHTGPVSAVAALVLPDGTPVAVTGSDDATVRVWNLATGQPLGSPLTVHTGPVSAVAVLMLPDGTAAAVTGSDATVRVWNLATGRPLGPPLTGHTSWVWAVATVILPDGTPVAVTGSLDATVRVWNLATGQLLPVTLADDVEGRSRRSW